MGRLRVDAHGRCAWLGMKHDPIVSGKRKSVDPPLDSGMVAYAHEQLRSPTISFVAHAHAIGLVPDLSIARF